MYSYDAYMLFLLLLADTNGMTAASVCIVCFQKQNSYGKFIVIAYNYIYALPDKKSTSFCAFLHKCFQVSIRIVWM